MSKRFERYRKLPIYKKAEEILELAEIIVEAMKKDLKDDFFEREILSNAFMLQPKIAGAEGMGLYSLKMQNAMKIRFAIQDMFNAIASSAMMKINHDDYVDLMRDKVEEFRLEFVDWVRGFDKSYDIPDNWAIRFDTSTPEQEKLEELMFDDDKFEQKLDEDIDRWNEDDESDDEDE